jgi:hypothetical protein
VGSTIGTFHAKWTRVATSLPKSLVSNRFLAFSNDLDWLEHVLAGRSRPSEAGVARIVCRTNCLDGGRIILWFEAL